MAVGDRTHRLTLQKPSPASGTTYLPVGTIWGSLRLASPSRTEQLRAGGAVGAVQWEIETHYRDDVRAEWRIEEEVTGRIFQITGYADPDDEGRDLRIYASEVQ